MSSADLAPEEWGDRYEKVRGRLLDFTAALERLIPKLVETAAIDVAHFEARTKSIQSFTNKIVRKRGKYDDPMSQITDLVGVRVILYYQRDVEAVGRMIESEFDVDWENSYRHDPSAEPDRFGYRSDHYVVRLGASRRGLTEWKGYGEDCLEIQVRTVMQHAWASVDHKIRYKAPDLPASLQRRLYRLSALLEVADGQFADLEDATNETASEYEASIGAGELEVALDALSLRAYLDDRGVGPAWNQRAQAAGFTLGAPGDRERWIEELLSELQFAGFRTLAQFQRLLTSADSWGDAALISVCKNAVYPISANPEHVLLILLQVAWRSEDSVLRAGWRTDIAAAIREAFELPTIDLSDVL